MAKFTVKKFNGDDIYSWAVFRAEDVKNIPSPVMYGQATPIVAGCGRAEADSHKKTLEAHAKKDNLKLR